MKQISNKNKVIAIILAIVIIIGIVMAYTKGIKKDILYSDSTKIELTVDKLNIDEIKKVAKEAFGENKVKIQTIGDFEEELAIIVVDMQDEALDNFQNKINELNGGEEKNIELTYVGKVQFRSIIKPYIMPVTITTLIIVLYMAIRYRKFGIAKQILYPIISSLVVELIYFSILVIVQIPIGIWTMPLAIFIYIITMIVAIQKTHSKKIIEE